MRQNRTFDGGTAMSIEHVIMDEQEQDQRDKYPSWCGLGWFHDCRGDSDVEPHYHDHAEIWLWHEGSAEGVAGNESLHLRRGMMLYTPAGCIHSYRHTTSYRNTGITPKRSASMRCGHLHVEETGENPTPEMPAFWFDSEDNKPGMPALFPRQAFLQSAYSGRYGASERVWQGKRDGWWALLVREGCLAGRAEQEPLKLSEGELLIVPSGEGIELVAETESEVAFALGWPPAK